MTPLTTTSTVAALIPHFECERWLADCIEGLLVQTRRLDAIIVLDDASNEPPTSIVERYPSVTLLRAERNVGPYRLVQQAIDEFPFDAYLFQDADDWSAPNRLERLLLTAERERAHLVGSYEVRLLVDDGDVTCVEYPVDVDGSLRKHPHGFPLLHPTSIVARSLVERLEGFASGMRFSGDAELLRRAGHVARIVNVPEYLYFRRKRAGALTTSPETGLGAPARERVQHELRAHAIRNAERVAAGEPPDLRPRVVAPPVRLARLCGPLPAPHGSHVAEAGGRLEETPAATSPILIVGTPSSGVELVAWSLAQADGLRPVFSAHWLPKLLREAVVAADAIDPGDEPVALERRARSLEALGRSVVAMLAAWEPVPGRLVLASSDLAFDLPLLSRVFPDSPILAVVRSCDDAVAASQRGASAKAPSPTAQSVVDRWSRASSACVAASAMLGASRVRTIRYERLLDAPRESLEDIFAFIGQPYDGRALRPFAGMPASGAALPVSAIDEPVGFDASTWWSEYLASRPLDESPSAPLIDRIRAAARRTIPHASVVAVISRGDDRLLDLDGRIGRHLPATGSGEYAGYHPGDDDSAIAFLNASIGSGARFLLVPATSFWWLDHYRGLRHLLDREHSLLLYDRDLAAIYQLLCDTDRPITFEEPTMSDPTHDENVPALTELERLERTGDPICRAIARALADIESTCSTVGEDRWIDAIERLRDRLNSSDEQISIALPSKAGVEKHDTIGAICRLRSKRPLWGRILMKLVEHLRPSTVVELGTCMGISTAYQAAGLAILGRGSMITLEGAPALAALSGTNLASIGLANVSVVQGLFVDTLPGVLAATPRIDFAFIDGHHDEHATLRYFEMMLASATDESVFAFDDVRWSDGMKRAWAALCEHPSVTTSIDLGVIGVCIVNGARRHGHFAPGAPSERPASERTLAELLPPLPAGARVVVVSRGDERLLELGSLGVAHFPHDDSGAWLGYHPGNSDDAVAMLEDAIERGATHLLVPAPSLWWLEFYDGFARRLDADHEMIVRRDELALYRLERTADAVTELDEAMRGAER